MLVSSRTGVKMARIWSETCSELEDGQTMPDMRNCVRVGASVVGGLDGTKLRRDLSATATQPLNAHSLLACPKPLRPPPVQPGYDCHSA